MRTVRHRLKPVSLFLAIFMIMISMPYQSAWAAMVSTEDLIHSERAAEARTSLSKVLAREDIQQALMARGIDPVEAQARVDSLTDAEAIRFAGMVDQMPAGAGVEWILGLAVFVFLVLLVTDILGYTDIFPFVKKKV